MYLLCLYCDELLKGKDHCDQEDATARNALQNYVDQGNNIQSTDDVFIALISAKMQSIKV